METECIAEIDRSRALAATGLIEVELCTSAMALAVDVVIGSAFFWRYSMMMTPTKAMMIDTNGIVMPQTIAVILYNM